MTKTSFDQRTYWNREVSAFDSIYSNEKAGIGRVLDSVFRWDMYARFEYTLRQAEPIKDRSFLDIGCGTGRYALELAKRGAGKVVGLDIAENMVEVCRERATSQGLSANTSFHRTDLLGYASDEQFDVTIGIGLFDYIGDPLPVLKRMEGHTKSCSILSFPRLMTWRAPVRKARLYLRRCDVFFYTRSRVASLVEQAGFASYECETIGNLYCVAARKA